LKTTTFALFALVVLISQPLIMTASLTFDSVSVTEGAASVVLAQEPGTRLTGTHLSNHVPVFINGTSDFVLQGWPGAGTVGNPYVISGLNITYDIDEPGISILNTNAYFIIRDTYVGQLSDDSGIVLDNVTHARVEYTTVASNWYGIMISDANNTVITHSSLAVNQYDAIEVTNSDGCTFDNNYMTSNNRRGIYVEYSNNLNLHDNTIETSVPVWYSAFIFWCENVIATDETSGTGLAGYAFSYCDGLEVSGLTLEGDSNGLRIEWCPEAQISGVMATAGLAAIQVLNSNDIVISGAVVSSSSGDGIVLSNSNHSLVTSSMVLDSAGTGISLDASNDCNITSSHTNSTANSGIEINDSNGTRIEDNEIENVAHGTFWGGIALLNSFSFEVISNYFHDNSAFPIYLNASSNGQILQNDVLGPNTHAAIDAEHGISENLTIADNHFENLWGGAYFSSGRNLKIYRNEIVNVGSYFIALHSNPDAEFINNTCTDSANWGMYMQTVNGIIIQGNTISDVPSNGLYFTNSVVNGSITMNTISDCWTGIYFVGSQNTYVANNVITGVKVYGMRLSYTVNSTFDGNVLTNAGFYYETLQAITYRAMGMSNNIVNGKPLYYAADTEGLSIDGSNYGQIILFNCSDSTITGGDFARCSVGVEVRFGHDISATGLNIDHQYWGLIVDNSDNFTIDHSDIEHVSNGYGITAWSSDGFTAASVSVVDTPAGGIYLPLCDNFTIADSYFEGNGGAGCVDVYYGQYGLIENSEFANSSYGVLFEGGSDSVVSNNTLYWCSKAIYSSGDNMVITGNDIHDNYYGINRYGGSDWLIANNTIRWNTIGVYFSSVVSRGTIADNTIAVNFQDNGYDTQFGYWDDGVDTGNSWDDYSGVGAYTVAGPGGSQDRYPQHYMVTEPIINTPIDIYYAEGSEGNVIVWLPFDNALKDWQVTIDGALRSSGAWNFHNITMNVDGLRYGTHTVVVTVRDMDLNTVTDTVLVHVYDGTPPVVHGPANQWLFVGATGQTVKWQVSDLHPATYTLTVDGNSFSTGSWTSGTLSINVDGINAVGEHTLVLTIYDVDGNSAQDSLLVQVIQDNVNPTIQQADNVTYVEGTTGNYISWNANDEYPDSYEVVFNGTAIAEGSWGGSQIVINVDGLAPGTYEYTLTVYDMSGNSATSAVSVTVMPLIPTIPGGEIDWVLIAIVAAVVGGAAVLVIVIYYLRKQRT
jgi:parallel beta-helix repeat protein